MNNARKITKHIDLPKYKELFIKSYPFKDDSYITIEGEIEVYGYSTPDGFGPFPSQIAKRNDGKTVILYDTEWLEE